MSGTKNGGKLAAEKNLARDPDFYKKIALLAQEAWKRNGRKPRGFEYDKEKAAISGAKGGRISKRKPKVV